MKAITRGIAVGIVLAGTVIGLAGPASADELNGSYTQAGGFAGTTQVTFSPCGPDCLRRTTEGSGVVRQFQRHGNTWVSADDIPGVVTIDINTLQESTVFPDGTPLTQQLTKNG
jgi:hypothetical protein